MLGFVKVLPNVTFRFDFELKDSDLLKKEGKLLLFARILSDIGIGAKTNVGYGKFNIEDIEKKLKNQKLENKIKNAKTKGDRCIAILHKSNKPDEKLFKALKNEQLDNNDKKAVFKEFEEKFLTSGGKWYKKIYNLLKP